jgi:UPF0755 protein
MRLWHWLLIVVLALGLAGAGAGAWLAFAPNTPEYEGTRAVKIAPGTGFEAVVDSLEAAGILRRPGTFTLVATATTWRRQIKPGHYAIGSGLSNVDLLQKLRRGLRDPLRLTVPPGTRPEVFAAVVARELAVTKAEVRAALRDTALAAELGTDTTHLFGYMMPETYQVFWRTSARDVVARIKREFDRFYARELAAGADSLGLAKGELVTMASIVQWEAYLEDEKPVIAGLYLNRLERGMPLQADPTVQYAVIEREGQKRRLFNVDYEIDHPYNTYQFRGLPPGPVTNPAPSTLRAVADPAQHRYLYMVAKGDGGHSFNRTLAQHVRDARAYHRLMRKRRRQQQ